MDRQPKIYRNETKNKINNIFKQCEARANDKVNPCRVKCCDCVLSSTYEKLSGIRLEGIHDGY